MRYVDINTGELITVYLFVGTLPYSQYSYVEPCLDMKMDTFIRCHINMYEYFGGVPVRIVCDITLSCQLIPHSQQILNIFTRCMGAKSDAQAIVFKEIVIMILFLPKS